MITDNTDKFFNLITRFNDIVRYNHNNKLKPSREMLIAQDYINYKVNASDIFNPDLNNNYLHDLSKSDPSAYQFISNLLN